MSDRTALLLAEAKVWRHNRSVYPGWLIAPESVRQTIRARTDEWFAEFVRVRESLSPTEAVAVLFELNWRYELALSPVWDPFAVAYEPTLAAVNPFPEDITDLPDATIVRGAGPQDGVDWAGVREQWLGVACALIRYTREERQHDRFEAWHARVTRVRHLPGAVRARLCYERCLFALAEFDDEAAERAVVAWPTGTTDPFWEVRRAAVLAEIGRAGEALDVVRPALVALRSGRSEDIFTASREGWAADLAEWIQNGLRYARNEFQEVVRGRRTLDRRYRELERYASSPDVLAQPLLAALNGPPPRRMPHTEQTPGFEPGTVSTTTRYGSGVGEKLLPAYQYMRLIEEVGRPAPAAGQLSAAADWFAEADPARALSVVARRLDAKLTDRYLSRHRVAALKAAEVTRLREAARRVISLATSAAGREYRAGTPAEERARDRLEAAVDVIARLAVRLDLTGAVGHLDLANELYVSDLNRRSLALDKPLQTLFREAVRAAAPEQVIARVPTLYRHPTPAEADQVLAGNRYDPVRCTPARFPSGPLRRGDEWAPVVRRHLAMLSADDRTVRTQALYRVLRLAEFGVLSDPERRAAGRVFWAGTGETEALPFAHWGDLAPVEMAACFLPRPGGRATDRLRRHLLGKTFMTLRSGPHVYDNLARLTRYLSNPVGLPAPTDRPTIEWSGDELTALFEKVLAWWEAEGPAVAGDFVADRPRFFGSGLVQIFLSDLMEMLRDVLLPRSAGTPLARRVVVLIQRLADAGLPVGSALPARLLVEGRATGVVVRGLRREFANPRREYRVSALRGIVCWATWASASVQAGGRRIPAVPADLLQSVATAVASRHPATLDVALDAALHIVRARRGRLDAAFVQGVCVGLDYLSAECAYRLTDDPAGRIAYAEVPDIRRTAARLVRALSDAGHAAEPAVARWLTEIAADPLPEVRACVRSGEMPSDDDDIED